MHMLGPVLRFGQQRGRPDVECGHRDGGQTTPQAGAGAQQGGCCLQICRRRLARLGVHHWRELRHL